MAITKEQELKLEALGYSSCAPTIYRKVHSNGVFLNYNTRTHKCYLVNRTEEFIQDEEYIDELREAWLTAKKDEAEINKGLVYHLELTEEELEFIYNRCSSKAARLEDSNLEDTPCYRLSWIIMNKIIEAKKNKN